MLILNPIKNSFLIQHSLIIFLMLVISAANWKTFLYPTIVVTRKIELWPKKHQKGIFSVLSTGAGAWQSRQTTPVVLIRKKCALSLCQEYTSSWIFHCFYLLIFQVVQVTLTILKNEQEKDIRLFVLPLARKWWIPPAWLEGFYGICFYFFFLIFPSLIFKSRLREVKMNT